MQSKHQTLQLPFIFMLTLEERYDYLRQHIGNMCTRDSIVFTPDTAKEVKLMMVSKTDMLEATSYSAVKLPFRLNAASHSLNEFVCSLMQFLIRAEVHAYFNSTNTVITNQDYINNLDVPTGSEVSYFSRDNVLKCFHDMHAVNLNTNTSCTIAELITQSNFYEPHSF